MKRNAGPAGENLIIPHVRFRQETLSNGLQVILCPSNKVPLVHITLHYRVGSSYEVPGLSGFAHLFEHMMFQGSRNVAKNEHGRYVDEAGGRWNATTSKDRTAYHETMPSNCLDLGLWLEADRMSSLDVTEENFDNQRQTVIEEKKQSYDNRPYGRAFLRLDDLAYESWEYSHPIIGAVEDLQRATLADAMEFHQTHYGPGNAVLVLSGDLEEDGALESIHRYFGRIPDRTQSLRPAFIEPTQQEEKRETIRDPLAVLRLVIIGYHMPPVGSPEYYALSILALLLTDGTSSRLYRRLVYERNWVAGLSAGPNQYRGPGMFDIFLQIQDGVPADPVLDMVEAELGTLCRETVSSRELEKARNQLAYRFVRRLEKVSDVGEILAHHAVFHGDPGKINREWSHYTEMTSEDILRVAAETFRPENRTLLLVEPGQD
jgi:predicted Zn-dependent peptidase